MDYNILIGGSAGQGIDTLSFLVEKAIQRSGYNLFSNKDYMSRIRGGHNFTQLRFGVGDFNCHRDEVDLLIPFDQASIEEHLERLGADGIILADEKYTDILDTELARCLEFEEMAREAGNAKSLNTVFFGALMKLFDLDLDLARSIVEEFFPDKIRELNVQAFEKGYGLVNQALELEKPTQDQKRILINSNQGIALGALAGGLTFYSAYPMTPSTSIMSFLAKHQRQAEIVVEQAEDEIAAVNMAIGASYAGVRAMTGTSGGGFSLMTESLGLAGMTETPLVIVNVQRPGPATGFPTRTEQSDLSFILTASHGEIPRFITSIRNTEESFYKVAKVLNLAEKYQVLAIILNDQYMADANKTIEPYDFNQISIDRYIEDGSSLRGNTYNRYSLDGGLVSPRIIPGSLKGFTSLADSDEHNEHGNITESADVRIAMMNKRMGKMELLEQELQEPSYVGVSCPETLVICWGSTQGAVEEAVGILADDGISLGSLCFGDIYPLPQKLLKEKIAGAKKVINIEQNYSGQLGKLIAQETGILCDDSILKYDGRQMSLDYVLREIRERI